MSYPRNTQNTQNEMSNEYKIIEYKIFSLKKYLSVIEEGKRFCFLYYYIKRLYPVTNAVISLNHCCDNHIFLRTLLLIVLLLFYYCWYTNTIIVTWNYLYANFHKNRLTFIFCRETFSGTLIKYFWVLFENPGIQVSTNMSIIMKPRNVISTK